MSGGTFNYDQYKLRYIADVIEQSILQNGKKREYKDTWEDEYHYEYPDEVIEKFKIAIEKIREAEIYAHRIDWLLAGDDGEETFLERLEQDLLNLKIELSNKPENAQ
jgi:hypothetical protein